ncbi:hypothetical protein [Streptomyces sp. NPDC018584]|uniref:hypothetical protein n=1 Tax=unclassified Streptomyces TaxID=2593676 RepID=UPI0037AB1659
MVNPSDAPAPYAGLRGGVGVPRLRVYAWPAADGRQGRTPHVHPTRSEGYAVTGDRGTMQTLTAAGFPVDDGDLTLHVLLQSCGLPEAGDAAVEATATRLDRLERGEADYLAHTVVRAEQPSTRREFGMGGRLDVYDVA